jgi:threonine/homoserine/homoserine lactone efflux protein
MLFIVANAAAGGRRTGVVAATDAAQLLAGTLTERFFRTGSRIRRRLERVTAAIFAGLAARLAIDIH